MGDPLVDLVGPKLTDNGNDIDFQGYVYINGEPAMPELAVQLKPDGLSGNVDWRIRVEYGRENREDDDDYPAAGIRNLPVASSWNIKDEFGTDLRGGKVGLTWRYVNLLPEQKYLFNIRGKVPDVPVAENYIQENQGDYWFMKSIAVQESGCNNDWDMLIRSYLQFNIQRQNPFGPEYADLKYSPNFGGPSGWGMMKIEDKNIYQSPQILWDWKENVRKAKDVLDIKRKDVVNLFEAIDRTFPQPAGEEHRPNDRLFGSKTTLNYMDVGIIQFYNGGSTSLRLVKKGGSLDDPLSRKPFRSAWSFDSVTGNWEFVKNSTKPSGYVQLVIQRFENENTCK